jgi:hypothetical protein
MIEEMKTWKWLVPAGLVPVIFSMVLMLWRIGNETSMYCASGLVGLMAIFAVQGWAGFRAYYRQIEVDQAERRKRIATTDTTTVRLESSRGVSPEVVRLILNEQHRVWMLRNGNQVHMPHSVLYHAPAVTDFFLEYFLKSSSERVVMPKRLLVEGRKNRFDPWGVVDEYEMYDQLVALLASQGKIVKYSEFENYQWVTPWTPKLVADDYGLVLDDEEDAPHDDNSQ